MRNDVTIEWNPIPATSKVTKKLNIPRFFFPKNADRKKFLEENPDIRPDHTFHYSESYCGQVLTLTLKDGTVFKRKLP